MTRPHVNRWLRAPTETAGACKHCASTVVRVRGLRPVRRPEAQGGVAGFTFCRDCDCLAFASPAAT